MDFWPNTAKQQPLHPGPGLLVVGLRPHTAPVLPTGRGRTGAASSRTWAFRDRARPATSHTAQPLSRQQVELLIRSRLEDIRSALKAADPNGTGLVSREEFRQVLQSVGRHQLDDVLDQVCQGGGATVDYMRFLRRFGRATVTQTACGGGSVRYSVQSAPVSLSELQRRLRDKIGGNLRTVIGAFRLFDCSRGGIVERREFRRILDHHCFRLTDKEFYRLWNHYSPNNTSVISYDLFLDKLGFGDSQNLIIAPVCTKLEVSNQARPASRTASRVVASVLPHRKLQALFHCKMCMNSTPVWQALQAFDPAQSGLVERDVLRAVLESFIFPMKPCSFQKLTSSYGVKAAGPVRWKHFLGHFMSPVSGGRGADPPCERVLEKPSPDEDSVDLHSVRPHLKEIHRVLATVRKEGASITRADLRYSLERPGGAHPRLSHTRIKDLLNVLDPEHAGVIPLARLGELGPGITSGAAPLAPVSGSDPEHVPEDTERREEKQQAADERQTTQWADKVSVASASTVEGLPLDKLCEQLNRVLADLKLRDPERSGHITPKDLNRLLRRNGVPLTDTHFKNPCSSSSSSRPGSPSTVGSYGSLFSSLGGPQREPSTERSGTPPRSAPQSARRQPPPSAPAAGDILNIVFQRVRSRLEQRRTSLSSRIQAVVRKADQSDETLSEADVRKVLEDSWVVLDEQHFTTFMELLGLRDGRIGRSAFQAKYKEAICRSRVPSPDVCPLLTSADECCAAMKARIKTIHGDNLAAFRLMDKNGRGVVNGQDFRALHDSLRFLCSGTEYQRLLGRMGLHAGGTLNYAQFLEVVENDGKPGRQPASVLQRLHELLASDARSKWASMSKVLCQPDGDGLAWIHKNSLRALLFSYALPLTSQQFDQLWSRYDPQGEGCVAVCHFLERLGFHHGEEPKPRSCRPVGNNGRPRVSRLPSSDASALQRIQRVLQDHHEELSAALTRLGVDGTVRVEELLRLLHSHSCSVSREQLTGLLHRLRVAIDCGRVPYMDFLSAFSPRTETRGLPPAPPEALRRIQSLDNLGEVKTVARMRQLVSGSAPNLYKAFSACDRGGTGSVGALEFRRVLESFCAGLSDRQFRAVLARLQLDGDNCTVNWKDFLNKFTSRRETGDKKSGSA